jgi:hypothetical protein
MKPLKIVPVIMMVMLLMFSSCKEAPVVSHPIMNKSDTSCLSCHQSGMNGVPVTSHPKYTDCLRCHKESASTKTKQ